MNGSLEGVLAESERLRTRDELRSLTVAAIKFNCQGSAVRHLLHVLPGDTVLVLGPGTAEWCNAVARAVKTGVKVTAAFFGADTLEAARPRLHPSVTPCLVECLSSDLPSEGFDWIVGLRMLFHERFPEALEQVHRLLGPGGQMLFFEENYRSPMRRAGRFLSLSREARSFASPEWVMHACRDNGFTDVGLLPYDLIPTYIPPSWIMRLKSKMLLVEHAPFLRAFCRTMLVTARKPGHRTRPSPNLANHAKLEQAVSVVVPCHNEAPNLPRLIDQLIALYGPYIREIILVNDNSRDNTAEVAGRLAAVDSRVRVVNRSMPNGVGRALRDGYRAATGDYILSMDCDFIEILPELRDLFDAIASGKDGAVGSRFSHDSVLINYPFPKLFFNRGCHTLIKLIRPVRDITNNLKLYRAEILKNLEIESPHFSANLETGLKPLLAGYDIEEVPISWINRTVEMGSSSFAVRRVGYDYARSLYKIWRAYTFRSKSASKLFGLTVRNVPKGVARRRIMGA
jgi:dolichol-phosphate mannosyltransferase